MGRGGRHGFWATAVDAAAWTSCYCMSCAGKIRGVGRWVGGGYPKGGGGGYACEPDHRRAWLAM